VAPNPPLTPAVLPQYGHHFSAGLKGGRKETKNRIFGFLVFLTAFYCWLTNFNPAFKYDLFGLRMNGDIL
jgi:hypothetical protein